jgi:mRNA-degrading endonuclease toxin of MazEF toxin-antitoxin module
VSDHESGEGLSVEVATPAGSRINGVILADQVKSLDWRIRQAEFICKLPRETTVDVLEKLGALLFDASYRLAPARAQILHRNAAA